MGHNDANREANSIPDSVLKPGLGDIKPASMFSFGGVMQIIFKIINESPSVLAGFYIDRDRTLVYKWLHNTASPSKKLIPDIIKFVMEKANKPMRVQIRNELDRYTADSELTADLKRALMAKYDFREYLEGVFNISIAQTKNNKNPGDINENIKRPVIKQSAVPVKNIAFALLASVLGGVIWNLAGMGGSGNEPSGLPAIVWGNVFALPIAVFAVLSLYGEKSQVRGFPWLKKSLIVVAYTIAGGIGGYIFYNSGFRGLIEALGWGYGLQETVIVFVYAIIIAFLPLFAILLIFRFPQISPGTFLLLEFCPALACVLAVLLTTLVNRPETEVAQLRGFLVGLILRLLMFISLRLVLKGYPDQIRFKIPVFTKKNSC